MSVLDAVAVVEKKRYQKMAWYSPEKVYLEQVEILKIVKREGAGGVLIFVFDDLRWMNE